MSHDTFSPRPVDFVCVAAVSTAKLPSCAVFFSLGITLAVPPRTGILFQESVSYLASPEGRQQLKVAVFSPQLIAGVEELGNGSFIPDTAIPVPGVFTNAYA